MYIIAALTRPPKPTHSPRHAKGLSCTIWIWFDENDGWVEAPTAFAAEKASWFRKEWPGTV